MDELSLIARLTRRQGKRAVGVVRGIGDDCAILRVPAGHDLLVHTDLTIEDVHFKRRTHGPEAVGAKAVARVLSDFAAMGGTPRWALVSLALPKWADDAVVNAFYDGLLRVSQAHGVSVVGGDLSRARQLVADVVVLGSVRRGQALRRDGAKPGDGIYVSGTLGHAAASRYVAQPEPRLALGAWLRGRGSAAMDLSDGLSSDLHRLARESKLAAELDSSLLPIAKGASLQQALHGGEDYELLFTAPAGLPKRARGVRLTQIGRMVKGPRGRVRLDGTVLQPGGWDPFQR
jgi:thiamine-monophosphate kinase